MSHIARDGTFLRKFLILREYTQMGATGHVKYQLAHQTYRQNGTLSISWLRWDGPLAWMVCWLAIGATPGALWLTEGELAKVLINILPAGTQIDCSFSNIGNFQKKFFKTF